jgi:hypothetical protein
VSSSTIGALGLPSDRLVPEGLQRSDRRRTPTDLYAYAPKVVGSRASQDAQHARAERLSAWALELRWNGWLQHLVPARLRALARTPGADLVGSHAVCAIAQHNDKVHAEVLAPGRVTM